VQLLAACAAAGNRAAAHTAWRNAAALLELLGISDFELHTRLAGHRTVEWSETQPELRVGLPL
jgi:hypothetical protein